MSPCDAVEAAFRDYRDLDWTWEAAHNAALSACTCGLCDLEETR